MKDGFHSLKWEKAGKMQLPVGAGREASCLTGWQAVADEETVNRITSDTKLFRYLLPLESFHVLHLAAIPHFTMAKRLMLYLLLNENQNSLTLLQRDCLLG